MVLVTDDARSVATSPALATLFRDEYEPMVRLAYLLVESRQAAEDCVQDAFVKLHGRLDHVDSPAAYLRTTVVNTCRSHHRKRAVRRAARLDDPEPVGPPGEPSELDPVWRLLEGLSPRRRAALVLRYYEDLSDEEVAEILDCRPATVRSLVHRALGQVREELDR